MSWVICRYIEFAIKTSEKRLMSKKKICSSMHNALQGLNDYPLNNRKRFLALCALALRAKESFLYR
jgi:hypothetical protein